MYTCDVFELTIVFVELFAMKFVCISFMASARFSITFYTDMLHLHRTSVNDHLVTLLCLFMLGHVGCTFVHCKQLEAYKRL